MRVSIQLDDQANDHHTYTSTDWVTGKVNVILQRAEAVSNITLSLQAKLISSVIAAASNPLDGTLHAVDNHKLFQISQVIFPQHDVLIPSKGFSLSKGNTSIPFRLRLPVLSSCQDSEVWIKHVKTTLPPSFKYLSPKNDGSATVEYYLRAEVARASRFRSDLTDRVSIDFLPLDPALPPPMLEPTQNKSTRVLRFELLPPPRSPTSPSPPTTTGGGASSIVDPRQITLAATLPAPAVLRIGGSLPLGVFVTAKEGSVESAPPSIRVRSLTLTLLTEITVHVGPNLRTWTVTQEILSLPSLNLEIQSPDQQELSKDLWKDAKVPETSTPSFTCCTLKQEHFVVVAVGLSSHPHGTILNMKTTLNVELHSGIERQPLRGGILTPEEEQSEEQMAFIPWRIGSDRHLGILGRRDSRADNEPPPPY